MQAILKIKFVFLVSDFYWKDFYGTIPEDAFPGGNDGGGNPTYIGFTWFRDKHSMFPTIIEKGKKHAWIALGDGTITSEDRFTKVKTVVYSQ